MVAMEAEDSLYRLQSLQRDLVAFTESGLSNIERLWVELSASIDDFRKFMDKKRRNDASRRQLVPTTSPRPETLKVGDEEYKVNEDFCAAAVLVADTLDLDELDAARLCIQTDADDSAQQAGTLPLRAVLRFHTGRATLLECVRLVLQQSNEALVSGEEDLVSRLQPAVDALLKGHSTGATVGLTGGGFFARCLDCLKDIEDSLKRVSDHRTALLMTGQSLDSGEGEVVHVQHMLLTRQHESLLSVMANLLDASISLEQTEFRQLITKAATLETTAIDVAIHYLPALAAASIRYGSNDNIPPDTAHSLHKLFEAGPGQQQWKLPSLKAAAIVLWLAEYTHRFEDPTASREIRVADRQKAEQARSDLFMQAIKDGALHFLLAACRWLKPEAWHDPAKVGLVNFLLSDAPAVSSDAPPPSTAFSTYTMQQLQTFTNSLVSNMPDILRRLKIEEDDQRRLQFSIQASEPARYEPHLERFIVIVSYAYGSDPESAFDDFWQDKDSHLHGFLRWVSQRLPTPRVAAFCELLTSLSSNDKTASHTHKFLLDDTAMTSGKLRKSYSVSWSQIFAELDLYASSLRERVSAQAANGDVGSSATEYIEGVETSIMLEAYLRLAAHVCRTSSEARNWLLREQSFHLGDVMFQLASSGIEGRIQASCFNMLSALLTDKISEVSDGIWVMLDTWIATGGPTAGATRPIAPVRPSGTEKQYMQRFMDKPETATAFVSLLTALVTPSPNAQDPTHDTLPFPENLGAPARHAGIEAYVDFAVGTAFRHTVDLAEMVADQNEVNVLRCASLDFMYQALSSFDENLMVLANASSVAVDAAIKASSLANYARLHPFARVMEWLFNGNVAAALFASLQHSVDELNQLDFGSPSAQAIFRALQVINLALTLQATYFDVVRPIIKTQSNTRAQPVANAAIASFDEVMFTQLGTIVDVTGYAACAHAEICLEALSLVRKLGASRKLADSRQFGQTRTRIGNRLIGALAPYADAIAINLVPLFQFEEFDLETQPDQGPPLKVVKAQAVLETLTAALTTSASPTLAHCLLGFTCGERSLSTSEGSSFAHGASLFHAIASCSAQLPTVMHASHSSWLLSVKRGCLDIVNRLAASPLTASLVRSELMAMDLLDALSLSHTAIAIPPTWDGKLCDDPAALLDTAAGAIRDFLKARELYFRLAALHLRSAASQTAYSVQEAAMSTLCGMIRISGGEQQPTMSVFDLSDFIDLETSPAMEVTRRHLVDLNLAVCVKDEDGIVAFDLRLAEELCVLRKRELIQDGKIRDAIEEQQVNDEITAVLASLLSQNNSSAIQNARLGGLEAWTELLSIMLTAGGLQGAELTTLALQGLQTILPRLEKSLASSNLESVGMLAKLTLTLVEPATAALGQPAPHAASAAHERLLTAFRICLKVVTDSSTDLGLRDACYRTCCAITKALPLKTTGSPSTASTHTRQLLQIVHHAGERVLTVATEDAFSGRGSTRVSAVLFMDSLVGLAQAASTSNSLLKSLSKLNFVPVLIDSSIGSIASSFQSQNEELVTALAYSHTALALILRICTTADGTQLVLNSGFFSAVSDSRLFSTDPDIGLDIDNPAALVEFYTLLSAVLRIITTVVISRGSSNAATVQQARTFLQQNRSSMQAVFKRTSNLKKTAGPPEREAQNVADEFGKVILVTGFLDVSTRPSTARTSVANAGQEDESAHQRTTRLNGFT